VKVLILSVAWV